MPEFNKAERSLYFSLTADEILSVKKYRTVKSQIYFIQLLACRGQFVFLPATGL